MEVVAKLKIATSPSAPRNDSCPLLPCDNEVANEHITELLDVISSIIADEYIQVARENPELFKK